jgi:hypothetical protein
LTERPAVAFAELHIRPATKADAQRLEALHVGNTPWAREVEEFVHDKALKRHLNPSHAHHHRLIVVTDDTGTIIGAAAHRATDVPFPPGTKGRERGTRLVFVALDAKFHGHDLSGGPPVSKRLMQLFLADVAAHGAGRLLDGTVHRQNEPSLRLCARFGLDPVQTRGDYVQILGALPNP